MSTIPEMTVWQARFFYWRECAYNRFIRLKLRVVYLFTGRTQGEASRYINKTAEWAASLSNEEAAYLYQLVQAGETDLKTALAAKRARAHEPVRKPSTDLKGWQ